MSSLTKVQAIEKVLQENGGSANWQVIYDNIEKYYPNAKKSKDWEAGLRGVLYREIRQNTKRFKKIGLSIYALYDYNEEKQPEINDVKRMHSYIEGICLELGNLQKFETFTADPSAFYRDNLSLKNFATLDELPQFSYKDILDDVKRIDVIWFNSIGLKFPQKVFEIVDSIGTLTGAFNRSLQLKNFITDFYIVAPEKHREKYKQTINLEIYKPNKSRFKFINYNEIIAYYNTLLQTKKIESSIF
ncbi:MAG: hypothetical protein IJ681_06950 [Bacteroidales bacterium]|nr:hypothetical protein [Bacteroidales bacterium]